VRWLRKLVGRTQEALVEREAPVKQEAPVKNVQTKQVSQPPTIQWLSDANNPWGVPVLDV
jgi:hypothetical protein